MQFAFIIHGLIMHDKICYLHKHNSRKKHQKLEHYGDNLTQTS